MPAAARAVEQTIAGTQNAVHIASPVSGDRILEQHAPLIDPRLEERMIRRLGDVQAALGKQMGAVVIAARTKPAGQLIQCLPAFRAQLFEFRRSIPVKRDI
jgi:hypothetical protein